MRGRRWRSIVPRRRRRRRRRVPRAALSASIDVGSRAKNKRRSATSASSPNRKEKKIKERTNKTRRTNGPFDRLFLFFFR